jgi:hydrogenase expression/formation protein HypD
MEALEWAKTEPEKTFVVTAVGFETTLPIYALLIERAAEEGIKNLKLFLSVKALMPALDWICRNNPDIDGFIGPGHVSTIIGWGAYQKLCNTYKIPLTVGGFGYEHIVAAVYDLTEQIKAKTYEVHNLYPNAVSRDGNLAALSLIERFFVRKPSVWRGLGEIDGSGYILAPEFVQFDAGSELDCSNRSETAGCLCGSVIIGRATPRDCNFFGKGCSPEHPLGPCMVSAEGTCGIWHQNGAK